MPQHARKGRPAAQVHVKDDRREETWLKIAEILKSSSRRWGRYQLEQQEAGALVGDEIAATMKWA